MGTKSKISPLSLLSLFLAVALSFSLTATDVSAEDAILNPGYITGSVSLGDMSGLHLNNGLGGVFKARVWASGKDSSGKELYAETWLAEPLPADGNLGDYTLTVHVPDGAASQDYDVSCRLYYTSEETLTDRFDFPVQSVSVSYQKTERLDFTNLRYAEGSISMTCKTLLRAWISGETDPLGETPYMRATVGSDGIFRFPVRQDADTKIWGHAYTENGHRYDLEAKDVSADAGNIVNISWTLLPGPCDELCEPSLRGSIGIEGLGNNVAEYHYGYLNDATYRTENFFGGTYSYGDVNTGDHRFWVRTFLNKDSDGRYDDFFAHPSHDPASVNVPSCDGLTHDISSRAAFVNGKITLGPRTVVTLPEDAAWDTFIHGYDRGGSLINVHWYWILLGMDEIHYNDNYDLNWWFRDQVDVSTGNYDMILAQGDWNVFYTTFHFKNARARLCNSENPKYVDSYLFVEDIGRKNAENAFSFQGGETVSDHNLSYETGAVIVKYYVNGGGSMTAPHLTAVNADQTDAYSIRINAYGLPDETVEGEVTFVALPGKYTIQAKATVNGSVTTFGELEAEVTPGECNIIEIGTPAITVTTHEVTDITSSSATCGGNATSDDGANVIARGVCWSTSQEPTLADAHTAEGTGTGSFTGNITGLASDTTYYVRAYATDSAGTFYGNEVSFKTSAGDASSLLVMPFSLDVSETGGTTAFHVANTGTGTMEWTASENADWFSISPESGTDSGSVTVTYDANGSGAGRSGTITVMSPDAANSPQTVVVKQAAHLPSPEAVINDCASSGGYEVSSYMASEIRSPEIHIFGVYETNSDHSFDYHPQGTADVYVERKGTPLVIVLSSYEPVLWRIHREEGVNIERIILNGLHEHQIEGAEGISVLNRSGNGNYISACAYAWPSSTGGCDTPGLVSGIEEITGTTITSFHGCYRATSFTIKDQSNGSNGNVTGNSVLNVDYEIAYVYASEQSTVNLKPGGNISYFSLYNQAEVFISGGEISYLELHDESTAEITSEVDIAWLHVADDSVAHIYGYNFSYSGGHLSGTWENGADFSFWALAGSPGDNPEPTDTMPANIILHDINNPQTTVTTDEVINNPFGPMCGGNVTSDNGTGIIARGVCWSTSQGPTIADAHTTDGAGAGSFKTFITGLASDTVYYVRAYATDSSGTFYGNEVSFTISPVQTAPDLIIQSQNANPTTLKAGSEISVSCEIRNQGDASSQAGTIEYYLSADTVYDSGDTLLGTEPVDSLAPGGTSSETSTLTIPSGISPGTWYLLLRADADGEGNTENNLNWQEITVTPDPPTPPANIEARSGVESVRLTWESSTTPYIESYNIYRSETTGGPWVRINTEPVTGESYEDISVLIGGTTYSYHLKTVDTFGTESEPSDTASAVFGQLKLFIPDARGNEDTPVKLQVNIANADDLAMCGLDLYVTYDENVIEIIDNAEKEGVERSSLSSAYGWDYRVEEPGTVKTTIATGREGEPLNGEGTLFWLNFNVKGREGDSTELMFRADETAMYDCDTPPNEISLDLSDSGIFTVNARNILCDLNGDGGVDSGDVAFLLSLAVGNAELTEDLLNVGDASGDRRIRSNDVIICTRIATNAELAPPVSEGKRNSSPRASSVDVSIPETTVPDGGTVWIPINISDAEDVAGADIVLNYDPNLVTATNVGTTPTTENCDLDFSVETGQVRISLSTKDISSLSPGSGALVEVEFTVQSNVAENSVSLLTLASVRLNDTYGRDFATSALQADVGMTNGSLKIKGFDLHDAILILKILTGTDASGIGLDADKSGKVGMEDALLILEDVAGTGR